MSFSEPGSPVETFLKYILFFLIVVLVPIVLAGAFIAVVLRDLFRFIFVDNFKKVWYGSDIQ